VPPLPSSSAQAARKALADRLREICKDAGLNGQELAARAGWHASKSSRIVNAVTPPSEDDIHIWCRVCDAEDQAADLISAGRAADSMYAQWRRLHKTGMRRVHESTIPTYERTRQFRVYASNVIPGMLQTPAYATEILSAITEFQGTPDDVPEAVAARTTRSQAIRRGDHRFALLIEESVLRYFVGGEHVMSAQLGYLLEAMALPSVALGVIPFRATRRPMWPLEAFYMFDDEQVAVETLSALVTITSPSEIAVYAKAFAALAEMAAYGSSARKLITAAIDALA
jgi:transcriptional regulator with XRE-family HTH domain